MGIWNNTADFTLDSRTFATMSTEQQVVSPQPNVDDDIVIDESAIANTLSQLAVTRKKKPAKRVSGLGGGWLKVVRLLSMPLLWLVFPLCSASSCCCSGNTYWSGFGVC